MASTTTALVTFAEFEHLPEPTQGRYELHHGEVVKLAPPKQGHKRIMRTLRRLLEDIAGAEQEVDSEVAFRIGDSEYRVADVAILSRTGWYGTPTDEDVIGAPELVAEVLSPSNTASEMLEKEQLCLENGSVEFWVVDAVRRQIKVTTRDGRTSTYKTGTVIPVYFGGSIAVDDVFRNI